MLIDVTCGELNKLATNKFVSCKVDRAMSMPAERELRSDAINDPKHGTINSMCAEGYAPSESLIAK
jgi:hypothetical protein